MIFIVLKRKLMLKEATQLLKITHPGGRGGQVEVQSQCFSLSASLFDN